METEYNSHGEPLIVGGERDKILSHIKPILDILEANPEDIKLYREYPFINSFYFSHKNLDIGMNISQPHGFKVLLFSMKNTPNKINDKQHIDEYSTCMTVDIDDNAYRDYNMDLILDSLEQFVYNFISRKIDDLKNHVEYLKQENVTGTDIDVDTK